MTPHTPEPWQYQQVPWHGAIDHKIVGRVGTVITTMNNCRLEPVSVTQADARRIVACVNGCAGLNPAAYRQVVEALTDILGDEKDFDVVDDALLCRWCGRMQPDLDVNVCEVEDCPGYAARRALALALNEHQSQ